MFGDVLVVLDNEQDLDVFVKMVVFLWFLDFDEQKLHLSKLKIKNIVLLRTQILFRFI